MHPDPKMSVEEVVNHVDEALKGISNNLEKLLETKTNPVSANSKNSFYSTGTTASISDKRKKLEEDLTLLKEGRGDLRKLEQETRNSRLVFPENHSP